MSYLHHYAKLLLIAALLFSCTTGCAVKQSNEHLNPVVEEVVITRDDVRDAPGVVEYVWEEPMVDVVDVPPGLDPEGIYYRPAHQAVIEIRQGRWRYYKRPNMQP